MTRWLRLILPLGAQLHAAEIREGVIPTPSGPRTYRLALPAGPARPGRPLVCLFHGHMGSAKNTLGQGIGPASPLAAWLTVADREGVVVVALDGAKGTDGQPGWNDGRPGFSGNPTTDDVAFTAAVIARVEREQGTDPARVYAMGMSNGAVFTFRLALELRHPLAAVAAACGSMPGERPPAPPKRPVPVLLIAGTEDPLMPYAGGQVRFRDRKRGAVLGVPATLAFWRAAQGLPDTPLVEEIPHVGRDATRATRLTWGEGGQVSLLRIEGGGHCEPSRAHALGWLYTKVCGPQNHDLEAAEEAWRFFRDRRADQ
ncbi:MAG TPA: PHB depolymerase family esterase [Holophagaceae bacterium]|nr:PHB depolymerase family esterase [Holophagaceae bacterium]HJW34728.1 PHB depolymerase family esterase [Holophagaceae bacterium]